MRGQWMFGIAVATLLSLGFVATLGISEDGSEKKESKTTKQELRRAEKVLAAHEAELLSLPGVVGAGLGMTKKGDRPAIHLYVNVKAVGGKIPSEIPKQIDKVPVRVIETDEVKARQ